MIKTKDKNRVGKIGGLVILIVISIFLLYSLYDLVKNQRDIISGSYETEGTVISIKSRESVRGHDRNLRTVTTYSPIIQYTDRQDNVKDFEAALAVSPSAYPIGHKVKVVVPGNNATPRIGIFMEVWGGVVGAGIFILLFLIASALSIKSIVQKLLVKS